MGDNVFDPTAATTVGARRARDNMALADAIEHDRVIFRQLWEAAVDEGQLSSTRNSEALRSLTIRLDAIEALFLNAMVAGYHGDRDQVAPDRHRSGADLFDIFLQRDVHNPWALWSVANQLRLPVAGPFVVIAVELPVPGATGLPEIESKLRSLDLYSAWHTLAEIQVGIVHVTSDRHLERALALVSRTGAGRYRIGVSAHFDDLRDGAFALHTAKVALRRTRHAASLSIFDGTLLATAAVSSPDVMVKAVRSLFDCFTDLPDGDRLVLFETFRVWQNTDGSPKDTAAQLACHPNTVRYRLRRIEERTGKSLSRPRDVAVLCLAFEVHHHLM